MAIANNTAAFMPNKRIQLFEDALEGIMHVFSKPYDVVLMRQLPDNVFLDFYRQHHISLPSFQLLANNNLQKTDIGDLKPWGWSPAMHRILEPYKLHASNGDHCFIKQWKSEFRQLYSREMAKEVLTEVINQNSELPLISNAFIPLKCTSINEVSQLLQKYGKGVIKAPWSSSGRGVQMLRKPTVTDNLREWLSGTIQQQGFVMFEQMLDVEQNIGLQFEIEGGEVNFLGYSFFYVSPNGQYKGNYLNFNIDTLPDNMAEVFRNRTYDKLAGLLCTILQESEFGKVYQGVLGVDTLLVNQNNSIVIQPCLEVNLRHTMGYVALALEKRLDLKISGKFEIWFNNKQSFGDFVTSQIEKYPLKLNANKIISGFLPLTSNWNAPIGAYILV